MGRENVALSEIQEGQNGGKQVSATHLPITKHIDDRGWLAELVKEGQHGDIKQVYVTTCLPGVIKAWHRHIYQSDRFVLLSGQGLRVCLAQEGAETFETHVLLPFSSVLVIPSGFWHGFQALGSEPAVVLNITTIEFNPLNPDEQRCTPASLHPTAFKTRNR